MNDPTTEPRLRQMARVLVYCSNCETEEEREFLFGVKFTERSWWESGSRDVLMANGKAVHCGNCGSVDVNRRERKAGM